MLFEILFRDSGKKLHVVANIMFSLYTIAGIIIGILYAFVWDDVVGALFIAPVVGFIVGYLNGLVMHLFASIAENLYYINKNTSSLTNNSDQNNN